MVGISNILNLLAHHNPCKALQELMEPLKISQSWQEQLQVVFILKIPLFQMDTLCFRLQGTLEQPMNVLLLEKLKTGSVDFGTVVVVLRSIKVG